MKALLPLIVVLIVSWQTPSQRQVNDTDKLATFCKVWGFLKYYHPAVASGKYDWDKEFLKGVESIKPLDSKEEISAFYTYWISTLGNVKPCKKCDNNVPDSLKFNLELTWLEDTTVFTSDVVSRLIYIRDNRYQGKQYYVKKHRFVGNGNFENEKPYADSIYPSEGMRLLGLARYWNIVNYFFPYKHLTDQNWQLVLPEMIPKFRDAPDTVAYHMAMRELTAKINDSHAGFSTKYITNFQGHKWTPFISRIIDEKGVVVHLYDDSLCQLNDIQKGDVFLSINDESIRDIIKRRSPHISASNPAVIRRNVAFSLFNGHQDSVKTTFERNGEIRTKWVYQYDHRVVKFNFPTGQPVTWKMLEDSIGYVDMGLLQPKETKEVMQSLKNTKAIVFDVRNYPNGTMYEIAQFLNSEEKPFAKFTEPDLSYPGVFRYTAPYTCGKKRNDNYKGLVVVLFNARTQSHAEFTIMALQTAPNVILVGSQTSGADGNVSLVVFPGNFKTYITGLGVYYPDGRGTQRIGIVPDIEVHPTIEGIRLGKDVVLEEALRIINTR